jgi:hypothetical protein
MKGGSEESSDDDNFMFHSLGAQALLAFAETYVDANAVVSRTKTYLRDVHGELGPDQYQQWCATLPQLLEMPGFFGVMLDDMSDLMRHMITVWISQPAYHYVAYFSSVKPGVVTFRFSDKKYIHWDPLLKQPLNPVAGLNGFEKQACPFFK